MRARPRPENTPRLIGEIINLQKALTPIATLVASDDGVFEVEDVLAIVEAANKELDAFSMWLRPTSAAKACLAKQVIHLQERLATAIIHVTSPDVNDFDVDEILEIVDRTVAQLDAITSVMLK